jgi:type I restriction enzyme, S subunit
MNSDWSQERLAAHVDLLTGFPFKSSDFTDAADGVRLLRGDNVGQGRLRWGGVKRWPHPQVDGLDPYLLKEGDVVLAMDRPWIDAGLKYAQVSRRDVPSLLVQRVARLRSGERLDQAYLRYVIGSPEFVRYVLSVQTGTAVPHISATQIGAFSFMLPPLIEQRRIAGVVGALDDKIEVERRKRDGLDRLIRLEGGRLVRDGADKWILGRLGDHYSVSRGLSYSGAGLVDGHGAGLPLHNLNSVREGGGYKFEGIKHYAGQFKDRHRVHPGDLVVANTEQGFDELLIAYPAIVPALFGSEGLYSHHLHRVVPVDGTHMSRYWLYVWLLNKGNHDLVAGYANGTTVNMLPVDALLDPVVPIPPVERVRALDHAIAPLVAAIEATHKETSTLASLRDALLPKLVSGAIRVPDSYDPDDALGTVADAAGVAVL